MKRNVLIFISLLWAISGFAQKAAETIAKLHDPSDKTVLVASHRADWRNFPENLLEGIQSAIEMGVDIVEIDLKRTRDGELILMHDKTVDRTTTGKGLVSDFTLDSIKGLNLKNGCGVKTRSKVPTLIEVLLLCKDKVVINVDQGFSFYEQVHQQLEETGTVNQVLIKSEYPADRVMEDFAKQEGEKMMFMPIINYGKKDGAEVFKSYQSKMPVIAYEVVFPEMKPEVEACFKDILKSHSKIWINTLWGSLCADMDDDMALKDPESIYGKHIKAGATIIQTDRPEFLIKYLRSKRLHK